MPTDLVTIRERDELLKSGISQDLVDTLIRDRAALHKEETEKENKRKEQELLAQTTPISPEEAQALMLPPEQMGEPIDIVAEWDSKTLADSPDFSLEQYVGDNPDVMQDANKVAKLAEVWQLKRGQGITAADVGKGVLNLPVSTAKAIYHFGKGTGKTLMDVFSIPGQVALGAVTGQDPSYFVELQKLQEKQLAEDVAGFEKGTFGFAQFMERAAKGGARKLGLAKDIAEMNPQEREQAFRDEMSTFVQGEKIGEGDSVLAPSLVTEVIREQGPLSQEAVNTVAQADPMGFFMFGQAFRALHAGAVAGKGVAREGQQLARMRQITAELRRTLPKTDPTRQVAEALLPALEAQTGKVAKAAAAVEGTGIGKRLMDVTKASADLADNHLRASMARQAFRQVPNAANKAALDAAETALREAETVAGGIFGATTLGTLKGALNRVSPGAAGVQATGRALEATGATLRGTARAIEAAPTVVGVAGAIKAAATGNWWAAGGLLFGSRLGVVKEISRQVAKPFRAAGEALQAAGKGIRTQPTSSFQQALRGLSAGSAETVAEGLRGVPIDVGFGLALAESPEEIQNMPAFGAAFRTMGAAGRPVGRFVQSVLSGPRATPASFIPRQAATIRNAQAISEQARPTLAPEQQNRLNAIEGFLREQGSDAPVLYVPEPEQFYQILREDFVRRTGRAPEGQQDADLRLQAQQRGIFAHDMIGDNGQPGGVIIATDPAAAIHEGGHAFQKVMDPNANAYVDMLVRDSYSDAAWDQAGRNYVEQFTGEAIADWRKWISENINTELSADAYLAREIGAENFAALFGATGGQIAKPDLVRKLAVVVDRTARFFGVDPQAGIRTSGLGAPVLTEVQEAIRTGAQQTIRERAAVESQPSVPEVPGAPPPVRPPGPPRPTGQPPQPTGVPNQRVPEPVAGRRVDEFTANTPERLNINMAREQARISGDETQQRVVEDIGQALQRKVGEPVVLNVTYKSALQQAPEEQLSRTARRFTQEQAKIAELAGAAPETVRGFFEKRIAATRFLMDKFSGGKLQLTAMSLEKVLANVIQTQQRMQKAGIADRAPYEIGPDGQFTDAGWKSLIADLTAYTANQANGYRGGGKEITLPREAKELDLAVPEVNPNYRPTILPDIVEQYMNTIMAIPVPKTAREFRGIVPGNIKGQVLREATGERVLEPGDIQKRKPGKQEFKSYPGRRVQEVNPFRQMLEKAGVNTRDLFEVVERLNVDRIAEAVPQYELQWNLPAVDVIRAGFLPRSAEVARVENDRLGVKAAAFRLQNGDIITGISHFDALLRGINEGRVPREAIEGGIEDLKMEDGFVDTRGNFLTRQEAFDLAQRSQQITPEAAQEPSFRGGELESTKFAETRQFLPTEREVDIANRTARARGRVGQAPTRTTKAVLDRVAADERVLDFGAGPEARQSEILREAGYENVTAHEFGGNVREGVHDPAALERQYDAVFASNVLNVQSSRSMLAETLGQIQKATAPEGRAIFNYPESPRKMEPALTADQMQREIENYYGTVERVGGTKQAPVWEARDPGTFIERDTGGRFRVPEEAIQKTIEEIKQERQGVGKINRAMPQGFTFVGEKSIPAPVQEHTADTVTTKTPTKANPELTKKLANSGVPVNQDGGISGGPMVQAMPREWRKWVDEYFLANPEVRKNYSQKEIDSFVRGMEQTAKIFGDFSMVPIEEPGSPIRQNSDPMFGLTFDLTTVCPKQDQFVAVTKALEAERGRLFTPQEKAMVGEMMREAGQAGCWICYGQGARNNWDGAVQQIADVLNNSIKVPDWKNATPEQVNEAFLGLKTDGELRKFVDANIDALREGGEISGPRLRDLLRKTAEPTTPLEELMVAPLNVVAQGQAKANAPKGFAPYVDQLLTPAMKKQIKFFNDIAGFRMNSQSDFRVWHVLDTAQFLSHLQSQGGMAHVYTRMDNFLRIFGKTGMKFNMSVEASDPATLPLAARVGNITLAEYRQMVKRHGEPLWDDMNSFPEERVDYWRKQLPNDAGSMLVAANDFQLWWGLENPKIDMIIPYHQGGVKPETTALYGARDYAKQGQHEHWPQDWKPGETRTVKLSSGEKVSLTMGGNKTKHEPPILSRAIHKGDKARYLEICEKFGIEPKFPRFIEHPNYMKLVRDVARNPMDQKVVDASKTDWSEAMKIVEDWVDSGAYEKETKADEAMVKLVRARLEDKDLPKGPVVAAGQATDVPEIIKAGKKLRSAGTPEGALEIKPPTGPGQPSVFQQIEQLRKEQGKRAKINIKPRS